MFTREILSRDETRSRMKSLLSMVKCLLMFTPFSRDEISSSDEPIPVSQLKFDARLKKNIKKQKRRARDEIF